MAVFTAEFPVMVSLDVGESIRYLPTSIVLFVGQKGRRGGAGGTVAAKAGHPVWHR